MSAAYARGHREVILGAVEQLAVAPRPVADELLSSWLYRLALANRTSLSEFLTGIGFDLDLLPSDFDIGTEQELGPLATIVARAARLPESRVWDLVRPGEVGVLGMKARRVFCPLCWLDQVKDGGEICAFTWGGAYVWQVVCRHHPAILIDEPRGLWRLFPTSERRLVLLVRLGETRRASIHALQAASLWERLFDVVKSTSEGWDGAIERLRLCEDNVRNNVFESKAYQKLVASVRTAKRPTAQSNQSEDPQSSGLFRLSISVRRDWLVRTALNIAEAKNRQAHGAQIARNVICRPLHRMHMHSIVQSEVRSRTCHYNPLSMIYEPVTLHDILKAFGDIYARNQAKNKANPENTSRSPSIRQDYANQHLED